MIQKKHLQMTRGETPDMTPMVDVTFLLLIFFMVTAAFSLQKSIQIPRHASDLPSHRVDRENNDEMESIELQIDQFGSFLVLTNDWDFETPGKQSLTASLKRARQGPSSMQLAIKVHEDCKLQFFVDAMDAGTMANFTRTKVTQVERF